MDGDIFSTNKSDCRQRIAEKRDSDTATQAEKKIATYLLDHMDEAMHSTLIELSEVVGVSDATLVRFCKSIGYKGFQEFKINAALECVPYARMYNPVLYQEDSVDDVCSKIFTIAVSALTRTQNALNTKTISEVADIILSASKIIFVGTGGSMVVAKDAHHKFLKIGIQTMCNEDKDIQLMSAALLREKDVMIAISHSGNNLHVVEAQRIARQKGATIVALTSQGKNQVFQYADYVLSSLSEATIFHSESASTRLAQLAIIDCLVAVTAFKDYDRSFEAMRQTREATSQNKL